MGLVIAEVYEFVQFSLGQFNSSLMSPGGQSGFKSQRKVCGMQSPVEHLKLALSVAQALQFISSLLKIQIQIRTKALCESLKHFDKYNNNT